MDDGHFGRRGRLTSWLGSRTRYTATGAVGLTPTRTSPSSNAPSALFPLYSPRPRMDCIKMMKRNRMTQTVAMANPHHLRARLDGRLGYLNRPCYSWRKTTDCKFLAPTELGWEDRESGAPEQRTHHSRWDLRDVRGLNAKAQVMDWYRHCRDSSAAHVRLLVKMVDTSNLTINFISLNKGRYGKKANNEP